MPDTHAFIGVLAQALYEYDVQIHLYTVGKILHIRGALPSLEGFDIGSIVAAAHAFWLSRDPQTAHAIQYAFIADDGQSYIAANEPPLLTRESQEA